MRLPTLNLVRLTAGRPGDRLFLLLVPLTGVLTGFATVALVRLLAQVQKLFWGDGRHLLRAASDLPWPHLLLAPLAGGLLIGLLMLLVKGPVGGTGTSGLIEALSLKGGVLRLRDTLATTAATLITVGSGGSLGREAPLVQVGGALGSLLGRRAGLAGQRLKLLLACGAASGIAAAYNAPIGGALFGLEVILGNFALESFGPIVVSTAIATVISRRMISAYPAYEPPPVPVLVSAWELCHYLAMGVLIGLGALLFLAVLRVGARWFARLPLPAWLKPAAGLLMVGIIGLRAPYVFGNGFDTVDLLLRGALPVGLILLLPWLKMAATAATAGSGGAGGLLTPTLFIGSMLGAAYGEWAHALAPAATAGPSAYALVGMGAMLAATTQAPLTAILMIFELTADYPILLPLMLACGASTVAVRLLGGRSLYTARLQEGGVRLGGRIEELVMDTILVRDVMRRGVPAAREDELLPAVLRRLVDEGRKEMFVVAPDGTLLGAITVAEMSDVLSRPEGVAATKAGDVAYRDLPTLRPDERLTDAIGRWSQVSRDRLPVVDEQGRYLGELSAGDIIFLYSQEVLHKEARLARFDRTGEGGRAETTYVELPREYVVAQIVLTEAFRGMTLRDLDARRRHGINVLEVKRRSGSRMERRIQPNPDMALESGDVLIVVGRPSEIALLQAGPQSGA
ncbi:MAG TPA: chloride channel protein [Candidatus Cryosericum sp.]|nr:chloride channel protein [Candidatus Cryosericum sp.]